MAISLYCPLAIRFKATCHITSLENAIYFALYNSMSRYVPTPDQIRWIRHAMLRLAVKLTPDYLEYAYSYPPMREYKQRTNRLYRRVLRVRSC